MQLHDLLAIDIENPYRLSRGLYLYIYRERVLGIIFFAISHAVYRNLLSGQ